MHGVDNLPDASKKDNAPPESASLVCLASVAFNLKAWIIHEGLLVRFKDSVQGCRVATTVTLKLGLVLPALSEVTRSCL
jgi:hypothetical protein